MKFFFKKGELRKANALLKSKVEATNKFNFLTVHI